MQHILRYPCPFRPPRHYLNRFRSLPVTKGSFRGLKSWLALLWWPNTEFDFWRRTLRLIRICLEQSRGGGMSGRETRQMDFTGFHGPLRVLVRSAHMVECE